MISARQAHAANKADKANKENKPTDKTHFYWFLFAGAGLLVVVVIISGF